MDYYGDKKLGLKELPNDVVWSVDNLQEVLGTTIKRYKKDIVEAAYRVAYAVSSKRKILLFGNGGSAADCQHLAAEFVGKFMKARESLPAIALTTDTSILTAVGNDYGFDHIFRRQIQGLGKMGDVAIAISTSGNSPNVLEGIAECQNKNIYVVGLTGHGGGLMGADGVCDICIQVHSTYTPRIQENHIFIGHTICELADNILYPRV